MPNALLLAHPDLKNQRHLWMIRHITTATLWAISGRCAENQRERKMHGQIWSRLRRHMAVAPAWWEASKSHQPMEGHHLCPDTRCTQKLVSEDVVSRQDLVVNTLLRKRVRAVSNQKLDCSGTVVFNIEFKGRLTEVVALVSSSITSEVLLTWQVLQRLGVINRCHGSCLDSRRSGHLGWWWYC